MADPFTWAKTDARDRLLLSAVVVLWHLATHKGNNHAETRAAHCGAGRQGKLKGERVPLERGCLSM
jgi:hypothetical protein